MKQLFSLAAIVSIAALSGTPTRAQYLGPGSGNAQAYPYPVSNNGGFGGRSTNQSSGFYSTAAPTNKYSAPQQNYRQPQMQQAPSTMQNLEQALDAVDNSNAWSRTPVSAPQAQKQVPSNMGGQSNAGMMPRVTKRDIARVMMEGGSLFDGPASPPSSGYNAPAPTSNSQATSTAYQGYQRAQNMATRAHNAANRARYNQDKWVRKKAADEAYYDANDADASANRAYYASQSGDSQARGYANLARQAANRARADANRARYNADTIQ